MKRHDITILERLQIGDRFYKKSDNSKVKEVFQVMDTESQIRTKSQKHFICPAMFVGSNSESQKTIPIAGNVIVVFLRKSTDVPTSLAL